MTAPTPPTTPAAPRTRDRWVDAAALSMLLAGGAHLLAALDHLDHGPRYAAFFLAVGVGQIALAPHPGRDPRPGRVIAALAGTVGLLLLYVVSRTVALDLGPHSDRPEAPDLLGTVVVVCELACVVALCGLLPPRRRRIAVNAVLVVGVAVWLSWFSGLIG